MKKNKGFTLIELLAIIVILAIIAVITVPIILNIIEESNKGAAKASAYGYKDAVQKWYLSKLQADNNYTLNGPYTISNGKLNNIDIPLSGNKPTNGTLTYSDNVLTGGCLTIGEYKVTFDSKGNPSSAEKGECESTTSSETILYYTLDPTAEEGLNGKTTSKEPEINPSWPYYIKETTQIGVKSYTIEHTENDETLQYGFFETLSECETEIYSEEDTCVEINKRITNEACGVENGQHFCLKPNDYENSATTLSTFLRCADPYGGSLTCYGSSLRAQALENGIVDVYNAVGSDIQGHCNVYKDGAAYCDGSFNSDDGK